MARKPKPRSPILLDEQYLGSEPEFDAPIGENDPVLHRAYNWYNYFHNAEDGRKFLVEYMTVSGFDPVDIKKIREMKPTKILVTACWLARIKTRGFELPASSEAFLSSKIDEMLSYEEEVDDNGISFKVPANVIESRVYDRLVREIDDEIDAFWGKMSSEFSAKELIGKLNPSVRVLNKALAYYTPHLEELRLLVEGDEEVAEGYIGVKPATAKKVYGFLEAIVLDINSVLGNKKRIKQIQKQPVARNKKVKAKKVDMGDKIDLLASDPDLDIIGLRAHELVGKSLAYFWVPSLRVLLRYVAEEGKTFEIKGNKLMNIDKEQSIGKKIRANRVEGIVKELPSAGKVALRKVMETISSRQWTLNGRIKNDFLLVRVVK